MGNRIIKESINESRSLAMLPPFTQDLFKRLITYADDYGRFNIDLDILRARLYPLELDCVTVDQIERALVDLVGIGKIGLYTAQVRHGGVPKIYGLFPKWETHQRVRNTRAKCPDPGEMVNDWALQRFVPIALRERVLLRDQFTCQECRRDFGLPGIPVREAMRCLNGALHIDHIVPVGQGGRATEENLRVLCASCNRSRPRVISLHELAQEAASRRVSEPFAATCGESRQSAANGGESRPVSNPIRIQSESVSKRDTPPLSTTHQWGDKIPEHIADLLDGFDSLPGTKPIIADSDLLVIWHTQGMAWDVIARGLTQTQQKRKGIHYALETLRNWHAEGKHGMEDFVGAAGKRRPVERAPTAELYEGAVSPEYLAQGRALIDGFKSE